MNKINIFIAIFLSAWVASFSQTTESGKAFNRFMSPQSGISLLSGTVAFSKPLAQISSGGVSTSLDLAYSSNVFREVQSRNDRSPGSWVGLGWALGRAMILCDHRGTIPDSDDSYSLVLPSGVRYQFVRDKTNMNKWWIEQQPYWKVERITKLVAHSGKSYVIVVGWKIVNESGLTSYYGDYDETPSDLSNFRRNATQHDLSWPSGPGLVGYAVSGSAALHPSAWNLSRQEDLDSNWLEYDYEQVFEKISVRSWTSEHGYTKESYLKEVRTSTGSSMKLILENKGHGDFHGEYWDSRGKFEEPDSPPDAFIDPLERKFLSAIEIFGTDGKKTGRIDFCYKALKISISGEDAEGYTKRLLVSVIHTDADGIEVDREDYDYYTESEKASKSTEEGARREPLGALFRINGPNCGSVEYVYSHFSLSQSGNGGIESHAQTIDIGSKHLQMGYLSDGTQYLVGIDDNGNVKVYGLFGGLWVNMPVFGEFSASGADILIGDKGWFAIYNSEAIIPAVWDSEKWVVGKTSNAGSSHEKVWAGPDYLVHTRADNNKLTIKIPWSRWGKTYNYTISNVDDSYLDRELIEVSAGRNHILISYIRNNLLTPNSKAVMVLTFSGDNLVETGFLDYLDNDNRYYLSGDYFYGLEESGGITGYRSSAWHWNGENWNKWLNRETLNGWQGNLRLYASGADYYAVRHNDDDDLTVFDWGGEYWSRPYKNKNMVDDDDFDLFVQSLWHGHDGNDFFVVTHPRNVWEKQRVCLIARPKLWGLKCVFHVDIPYWQTTHRHARVTRFEKRDGAWSATGSSTLGCPNTRKEILIGQDWYAESACAKQAWIWDSQNWREEKITDVLEGAKSIGGGFFYKKQGSNNTQAKIYRKLDDSFVEPFGAFVVTEKRVSDPVVDQSHVYAYGSYIFAANQEDGGYAFDGPNNTPLVEKVTITLPENAGALRQIMCSPRDNGRIGMGQVCEEENLDAKGKLVGNTKYFYGRFRSSGWPYEIYVDRLDSVKGISGGMRIGSTTSYNVLNGLPSKVVELSGGKKRETRTIYAAEHYNALKNANRLSEVAASYTCIPSCDANGKISQASAMRYGTVPGAAIPRAFENWSWEPATVQAGNSFNFNWNSPAQSSVWKKAGAVTLFYRGRPVENVDRLGLYSALFHESNEAALAYAKVTGSRRDAALLIPGESCEVSGLANCNLIVLQGNATDGSGLGYGRFSAAALLSPVTASLAASAGGLYRFSAWVQGVDMAGHVLQLSFNGQAAQGWTIAGTNAGNWQRIQWEGTLPAGVVNIALSAQGSPIRVQDIRLQPYDALSSVTFWERSQGIPLVQVDERGVGSYVKLDAAGRVKTRYMEDEAGMVFLSQQLNYASANCKDNGQGTNRLSMLKINGISIPLSSEEQFYVLPDGEREFSAKWVLFQKRDKIRYQLYPEGQEANAEWISACCGEIEAASGDAVVLNWVLRLDVEPFSNGGQADYTIHIQKDATGWTDHGGLPSPGMGSSGRYTGNHESGRLIFVDNAASMILKEATFDGNTWQLLNLPNVRPEEFHVAGKGNSRYLVQLPMNTGEEDTLYGSLFGNAGNAWSEYGVFAEKANTDLIRAAVDGQNRPWVIYRRARVKNDSLIPGSLQAVRWNAAQNEWEKAGSMPVFAADTLPPANFLPGRVSDRPPEDADIVSGSDGNMYVAYIGSVASIGIDSLTPSYDSAALRAVVVKRLYGAVESRVNHEIWAGPSLLEEQYSQSPGTIPEYDGDILTLDGAVLIGARRVRMASDGENIYLAVAHSVETNQDGMLAVTVFKGTMSHIVTEEGVEYRSKLVFKPLADTSVKGSSLGVPLKDERNRAFYLKSSEPFDFVVRQGTPYLAFANSANRQKLTVIYHTGSRWLSVGNPAFAPLAPESGQLNLSVDFLKKPYVVYKEGLKSKNAKRRNRVVPMKYEAAGDRDMTLNAVGFSGAETSLSSEFRQYILNYQASFDATASSLSLSPSPMAISDIVGVQVENNGSLIGSWVISPNSYEADRYMNVAVVNYSGTSVPAFEIPLAEGLNVVEVKVFGKNGKQLLYTFELSREFLPNPGLGISGGSSSEDPVCIWFSTGWSLKCGEDTYYSNACFENNFENALECELSGGGGGIKIPIVIKPGGGDEGSGGDGGEGNGSGGIPPELRPWSNYSLFASTNLNFADRVIVERGPVAAGSTVEVGVESKIRSEELISGGDVWLRNRSNVQNIILSGELHTQQGATYTGVEYRSVDLPALPVLAVHVGTENITAGNNQQISIAPGNYGNFQAYSRSVVSFASGDYHFNSFILEPDVKLELGVSEHGVRIWVQGELRLADRIVLENLGTPEKFLLYTNSSGNIRLGTSNALRSIVVAPMGTVEIPSRVTYTSSIWAKNIIVQPDVQFPSN